MAKEIKKCRSCGYETEDLFAPREQGAKIYCSDCQLEIESEMLENEAFDSFQDFD